MENELKFEWYKLLVKSRGAFIIGIFIMLKTLFIFIGDDMSFYRESIQISKQLNKYYSIWGGRLTEQASKEIEEKNSEIQEARQKTEAAFSKFYMGKMSEQQIDNITRSSIPVLREEKAFKIFYTQYLYVKENPEERHLINTQGWTALLNQNNLDFLLIITAILLSTLVFAVELKNDMLPILQTTPQGKNHILLVKLIVIVFIAISLCIISGILNLIQVLREFSLASGLSPLQSVQSFSNSPYMINLWSAFFIINLIRIIGILYVCLISFCFTEFARSTYIGTFLSLAIIAVVYFTASGEQLYYHLPTPVGLIDAHGYLSGPVYQEMINGASELLSPGITIYELIGVLLESIVIMFVLYIFSFYHYDKKRIVNSLFRKRGCKIL